jgi:hypothetical protein
VPQLSAAKGLTLAENARLFALLNMGVVNTFIIDWDAKFTYNFWRPGIALRNGDMDSNDATERDPRTRQKAISSASAMGCLHR